MRQARRRARRGLTAEVATARAEAEGQRAEVERARECVRQWRAAESAAKARAEALAGEVATARAQVARLEASGPSRDADQVRAAVARLDRGVALAGRDGEAWWRDKPITVLIAEGVRSVGLVWGGAVLGVVLSCRVGNPSPLFWCLVLGTSAAAWAVVSQGLRDVRRRLTQWQPILDVSAEGEGSYRYQVRGPRVFVQCERGDKGEREEAWRPIETLAVVRAETVAEAAGRG
jgi:hypothetical protein